MPANLATSMQRTELVSGQVLAWYARLLEWAIAIEALPEVGMLSGIFPSLRPPRLPQHSLARSRDGTTRYVRCLLPAALIHKRQCREAGTLYHAVWASGEAYSA